MSRSQPGDGTTHLSCHTSLHRLQAATARLLAAVSCKLTSGLYGRPGNPQGRQESGQLKKPLEDRPVSITTRHKPTPVPLGLGAYTWVWRRCCQLPDRRPTEDRKGALADNSSDGSWELEWSQAKSMWKRVPQATGEAPPRKLVSVSVEGAAAKLSEHVRDDRHDPGAGRGPQTMTRGEVPGWGTSARDEGATPQHEAPACPGQRPYE